MRTAFLSPLALLGTALAAGAASAAPLVLPVGGTGPVPVYDGRLPDQTTVVDAACGYFAGGTCTTGTSVSALQSTALSIASSAGGVIEAVGTTQLNPYGANDATFAFIFGGTAATTITSASVSSFAGYSTQVEACGPIFGSQVEGCTGAAPGIATRSGGTGNTVSFTPQAPAITLPSQFFVIYPYTDGYVIYTNAPVSAIQDPTGILSVSFSGGTTGGTDLDLFGLTAPSTGTGTGGTGTGGTGTGGTGTGGTGTGGTGVPEPGTLSLFGLALMGLGLTRRRRSA
jgi:hypothetical protein